MEGKLPEKSGMQIFKIMIMGSIVKSMAVPPNLGWLLRKWELLKNWKHPVTGIIWLVLL